MIKSMKLMINDTYLYAMSNAMKIFVEVSFISVCRGGVPQVNE